MSGIFLCLTASVLSTSLTGGQVDLRDNLIWPDLVPASGLREVGPDFVHIAMIVTNVLRRNKTENKIFVDFQMEGDKTKIAGYFERFLASLFLHSTGTPLHLILVTEEDSRPALIRIVKNQVGKHLSETLIKPTHVNTRQFALAFPKKLRVEFVDIESIVSKHREEIDQMKKHFGHHMPPGTVFKPPNGEGPVIVPTFKYTLDLFYMVPFYHKEFPPALEKLVVLDLDLEIKVDLIQLYKQFKLFRDKAVVGLANDQTPHYLSLLKKYIERNPGTSAGSPGLSQGMNTGVALYHLGRMRESREYNEQVDPSRITGLAEKFMLKGTVGDQDWLTALSWEMPELFYLLPCQFNVQTDQTYNTEKWSGLWSSYHHCPHQTLILHRNGE